MARRMTLTIVVVVAIFACCLLAAELAAGVAAGVKKGSAPKPKESSAAKAEAVDSDVTVDSLIALATKTIGGIKDIRAKVVGYDKKDGTEGEGTYRAIPPDYVAMDAVNKKTGQKDQAKGVTRVMYRQIKAKVYMEQTGQGQAKAMAFDTDELAKIDDPTGRVRAIADNLRKPNFPELLKVAKGAGMQLKVVEVQDDTVKLEVIEIQESPTGKVRVKKEAIVHRTNGLLRELISLDADGKAQSSIRFEDYKFNTGLKPDDFAYTPTDGITVLDFTERLKKMAEQFKRLQKQTEGGNQQGQ